MNPTATGALAGIGPGAAVGALGGGEKTVKRLFPRMGGGKQALISILGSTALGAGAGAGTGALVDYLRNRGKSPQ